MSTLVGVTGTAAITALGPDAESTWSALLDGRTALRGWDDLAVEGFPVTTAARIPASSWGPEGEPDRRRRGRALAVRAAHQALRDAGLLDGDGRLVLGLDRSRVGCYIGTTMGESAEFEGARERGSFDLSEAAGSVFAAAIATEFGITGPLRTFGAACAAGNYAVDAAARDLAAGRIDVAVAGGVEPFSRIAMVGFARMRAMAPDGCTPFGAGRRGMSLGEGAGLLVLQRSADVDARAVRARIGSIGLTADAHHPTSPREDGTYMQSAMRIALERTGVAPAAVGWVSAHGTGTILSDAVEARSLTAVFGQSPPVSSLKGALGHTMGAAAAIESVMVVHALRDRMLPPNTGTSEVDPILGVDVIRAPRRASELTWVLNCAYAFGGLNSALMIGRAA